MCSKARCLSPALSLAAAAPASPGCNAKLFNAAVSRQSESWAVQASLRQQQRCCGRKRRRRPSHSVWWDLRGPSRDVPSQGSFQEEDGGPRETGGKVISLAPHMPTLSFTHLEFPGSERGALPPPNPPPLPSGRERPSDELTHAYPSLRKIPA